MCGLFGTNAVKTTSYRSFFEVFYKGIGQSLVNVENDVLTVLAAIRLNEFRQVIALDRINGSDIYTPKRRASVFVRKRDAFFKGVEGLDRVLHRIPCHNV